MRWLENVENDLRVMKVKRGRGMYKSYNKGVVFILNEAKVFKGNVEATIT